MKKLLILLVLFITSAGYSQNLEKKHQISTFISPGAFDDGFNIGVQFQYNVNDILYAGPELFYFPQLHNIDYLHFIGRVGLNIHIDQLNNWLILHSGLRIGGIFRQNEPYGLLGLEAGVDIKIIKGIYLGFDFTSDMKGDSKLWSQDSHHTVNSGIAKLSYIF